MNRSLRISKTVPVVSSGLLLSLLPLSDSTASYRADADAGGCLGLAVWGGAAGGASGGESRERDELDALWQDLLLLLQVAEQLNLGLSRQLVEQGILGKLLQGQWLCWYGLRKEGYRLWLRLGFVPGFDYSTIVKTPWRPQIKAGSADPYLCDVDRWGQGGRELLWRLLEMEVRGEGERHHRRLPALCCYSHGGLRGGGDPCGGQQTLLVCLNWLTDINDCIEGQHRI